MVKLSSKAPNKLAVGGTACWLTSFPDYSSDDSWSVKCRFINATNTYTVTAESNWTDDDGQTHGQSDWYFAVDKTLSDTFAVGIYNTVIIATTDTQRIVLAESQVEIVPGVFGDDSSTHVDALSHARKMLSAIEAVLERRATTDQESYSINGRSITRIAVQDLILLRDKYRREVAMQERVAKFGNAGPGKVLVRF